MSKRSTEDQFAVLTEPTTLVIHRWLPGPAERIWRYLTDSELRGKWLAKGDMTQSDGAAFELIWTNDDLSAPEDRRSNGGVDNRMTSKIVAIDPGRSLTFTWGDGTVTFDLEPVGERVKLTVTHTGLEQAGSRQNVGPGWHAHLDILVAEIEGGAAPSFWASWARLKPIYDERFGG